MVPLSVGSRGIDQQFLHSFERNSARAKTSIERLSTGKRINRPSDDPAGFVAADELRGELIDLKAELKGISSQRQQSHFEQSGLANIQSALTNIRDRVVAAANDSISPEAKAALQAEISEAAEALNRIAESTGNNAKVLKPSAIQELSTGEWSAEIVESKAAGVSGQRTGLATYERTNLDTFEHLYQDQVVITTDALSKIEDTDFAAETASLAQSQVLSQGAMAALTYANRQRIDQITVLLDEMA
jgi:flagellin